MFCTAVANDPVFALNVLWSLNSTECRNENQMVRRGCLENGQNMAKMSYFRTLVYITHTPQKWDDIVIRWPKSILDGLIKPNS
jgi:hypothetical protein